MRATRPVFVEADFRFGKIEVERAGFETQPPDPLRQFIRVMQHFLDGTNGRALENREHFLVAEAPLRMNDRGIKLRAQHAAIVRHEKLHALGQAIHVRFERAEFVAQRFRQHRNHAVHEVSRVAAFARLVIERRAGLHVMRHVRDVDPQLPLLRRDALQANRVVEILRVIGINRDDLMRAAIRAARHLIEAHFAADGARFGQHVLGKVQRQVVLAQHRKHVHAFLVRRAEHFDDFAFGIRVARFPFAQLDHHFVAHVRGPADIARRRHVNVVRHARIVGNDVEKLPAPLQRADDLRAPAFQDADDRSGILSIALRSQTLRFDISPYQNAVFVQGGGGGILRNGDLFKSRIVRLEKPFPAGLIPNLPDQIGFPRSLMKILFRRQLPDCSNARGTNFLLLIGRQIELPE